MQVISSGVSQPYNHVNQSVNQTSNALSNALLKSVTLVKSNTQNAAGEFNLFIPLSMKNVLCKFISDDDILGKCFVSTVRNVFVNTMQFAPAAQNPALAFAKLSSIS